MNASGELPMDLTDLAGADRGQHSTGVVGDQGHPGGCRPSPRPCGARGGRKASRSRSGS